MKKDWDCEWSEEVAGSSSILSVWQVQMRDDWSAVVERENGCLIYYLQIHFRELYSENSGSSNYSGIFLECMFNFFFVFTLSLF